MRTTGTASDWYRERETWREEAEALRALVLEAGLEETVKWGQPTYLHRGKNVLMISARKEGAIISFFQGALLADPAGTLVSPGENSRHVRYLLIRSVDELKSARDQVLALVRAAIALSRCDVRVLPAPPLAEEDYAPELQARLASDERFRTAFEALTPGRRRAYNMHFAQAKQAHTREARIDRCTERILAGKGLNDCVCGLSKRMPGCDGSHKHSG